MTDRLSNRDARRLFISLHGLSEPLHRKLTDVELAMRIEQIGFVQIDSVNTVERAHHMILHARNRTYRPEQMARLLEKDRLLFENWTHDASAIPTKFYPYWGCRFRQNSAKLRERWRKFRRPGFEEAIASVLARISDDGPVMARDLGDDKPKNADGWWDWHPSKTALEFLWRTGVLAVCRREGFQKVYDLTERVIPEKYRACQPNKIETIDWLCRAALERLGFATAGEIANYWETVSKPEAQQWCRANLGNGLREIEIECTETDKPCCVFAFDDVVDRVEDAPDPLPVLRILSPFDPMIRDRQRANRLFGFDYRIEIFVPAHKRQYGYYVFPIMEGDRFVGRIDIKHRRQEDGSLHVTGLWPERKIKFGRVRQRALETALEQLRRFCGAGAVTFSDGYFREGC